MPTNFNGAMFCENGHCIDDCICNDGEAKMQSFCTMCGALVLSNCPLCNAPIKGLDIWLKADGQQLTTPKYCYHCGEAYPWTLRWLDSARELIAYDETINDENKKQLCDSLPDIISETPKTKLAARKLEQLLLSAGKFTAEGIRQFALDFGCDLAKKMLGL